MSPPIATLCHCNSRQPLRHSDEVTDVELVLLGQRQRLPAEEAEREISRHSGRQLQCFQVELTVADRDSHEELQQELEAARGDGEPLQGSGGARWLVSNHSYSFSGDGPFHHSFVLKEVEVLQASTVSFEGISLSPERYLERFSGDDLVITLTTGILAGDNNEALEELIGRSRSADPVAYFPVTRTGISDSPVRMRFGQCLWQETEVGRRHVITLVADEDSAPTAWLPLGEPETTRVAEVTSATRRAVQALIDELTASGSLGDEAAHRVLDAAEPRKLTISEQRELERCDNVDDFF